MRRFHHIVLAVLLAATLGAGELLFARQATSAAKPPQAAAREASEQKPGQKDAAPAEASREVPPERKAYSEANRIADPDKKIEALKKVIADFPKTSVVEAANNSIFTTLVAKMKETGKQAIAQAEAVAEAEPEASRAEQYGRLASTLLGQDVLLEDAEAFAVKGLEGLDEKRFVEARKASLAKSIAEARERDPEAKGLEMPDDREIARMYTGARQSALSTLGQIYARRGKHAEAEKALRDAYTLDPRGNAAPAAATRLADYARKAGRDAEQMEYLTVVALAGRLTAETKAEFEAAYRKSHNGTLDGLEAMLDARYEKDNPMPVHPKPYQRPAGRTDRVVLAEIFTGAGCPPCVGADLAFEAALERYARQDLAVLMYHLHIPRPDPLTNPSTQARQKMYEMRGVPSLYIDGVADGRGGGNAASASRIYTERVEPAIEKRLVAKAEAKIALQASSAGRAVQVKAGVTGVKGTAKKVRLQLALVEERVRYSGENGVRFHPMVVRSLAGAGDVQGFAIVPGKPLQVSHTFDIDKVVAEAREHLDDFEKTSTRFPNHKFLEKKHDVDASTLAVVAFVQDEDSKAILQAAVVRVGK